ncbi:HAD family hydrolase [Chromobacterium haemolyticum]|uniref:HAD-IIB family hydrolase n=1 Tax=Chromobacterium haemolyticum TaxID=394935 RepID=UPI000D30A86D|nr:HAD family hydrolase [Chromobacterium haemolyticum]PTU69285.1 hydrolase [Chromobacterium haemolyticum]QOD84274.1 HAD family phosphatase [Chromobacterium haemolyticum]BBH12285.1 hydrolase [Chromobacterium haemolyticum]
MHFIFDIDGTICFNGRTISPIIQDALDGLRQRGHQLGFASARPYRDILPLLDARFHDTLIIGANGAMSHQQGELRGLTPIPDPVFADITQLAQRFAASYLVDLYWDYHYSGDAGHPFLAKVDPGKLASHVGAEDIRQPAKLLITACADVPGLRRELDAHSGVELHHHSDEQIFDITAAGVSKMAALRQCGIDADELICFGNDSNDVSMFLEAGHSVQVGAHPRLAELASERLPLDQDIEARLVDAIARLSRAPSPARRD